MRSDCFTELVCFMACVGCISNVFLNIYSCSASADYAHVWPPCGPISRNGAVDVCQLVSAFSSQVQELLFPCSCPSCSEISNTHTDIEAKPAIVLFLQLSGLCQTMHVVKTWSLLYMCMLAWSAEACQNLLVSVKLPSL